MRLLTKVMFVCLITLWGTSAFALTYTSSTSLLGSPAIDFQGFAEGTLISSQYSGVTFGQVDGGTPMIDNAPELYGYTCLDGSCLTGSTNGGAPYPTVAGITADFDFGVSAVEVWFTDYAPLGNYNVISYDASGSILETITLTVGMLSNIDGLFVGLTSLANDIWSVQFGPSSADGDAFAIDNFKFEAAAPVPEPSTVLLLGGGLIGLAWYGRKRKQA